MGYALAMRNLSTLACGLALIGCTRPQTATDAGPTPTRDTAAPSTASAPADAGREGDPDDATEDAGSRDHMHLTTDGVTKDVWISGWASIPHPSHREYAFEGPLGCAGQRFTTTLTTNTRLDIGDTAKKAFVIVVEEPYVLDKPPVVEGKSLVWAGDFVHADGSKRRFVLRIDCPLPKT